MPRLALSVWILALTLAACGGDDGGAVDETTGTTGGESTTTTTSADESTGGPCPMCVAPAPEDWFGPIFVSMTGSADPVPTCLVGEQMLEAFSGLNAPDQTCGCECGGGVCAGSLECGMDPACVDAARCGDVDPDTCVALPEGTTSVSFSPVNMACVGMPMPSIPMAYFTTNIIGCAAATEESCDTGFCANPNLAPFDSTACIYIDYDTSCPGAPYTEKTVLYTGFDDERQCSQCACAAAGGGTCGGAGDVLELHTSEMCDAAPLGTVDPAGWSCADATGATHVRFDPAAAGGCEISEQSEAFGVAVETGPLTLCCVP